jgi:malate dehydrogenase (oxaloacetate-decarboxylating)(NADP+)
MFYTKRIRRNRCFEYISAKKQFNNAIIKVIKKEVHSGNSFKPNPLSDGAKIGDAILTTKHGFDILHDPSLNKGTAFPIEERERLGVRGLVPPRLPTSEGSLEWQEKKIMVRFRELKDPIHKYKFMNSLHDRNEVLFFRCLSNNIKEIAPIIYTPTVGTACLNFGTLFRRPRGMYFSAADKGLMYSMTFNWHTDDVELIVVTDGSRVLGLGDLGTNGMGISLGKLQLYTACAGIHPSKCLPVVIDVGTNNESLIQDRMYLGLQQKRLSGEKFDEIIDEFLSAVRERFPNALIQFEDFNTENASRILEKYRNKILCFNDDMQGTATVTLAGLLGALRATGHRLPEAALLDQRIIVVGAGTAGLGVSSGILYSMMQTGLSEEEARKRFWIVDDKGVLGKDRKVAFSNQQKWVRNDIDDSLPLEELVKVVKPTVLLGLTGVGGLFTEKIVREMAKSCDRPIIFPMSNPTDRAECQARDAYEWTDGRCIFASGSPFDDVEYKGKIYKPTQSNNMYSYPGIGLGALVCRAKTITDKMLNKAAIALANSLTESDLNDGRIFPLVQDIPKITKEVAFAVAKQAYIENLGRIKYENDEAIRKAINDRFWIPKYGSIIKVDHIQY